MEEPILQFRLGKPLRGWLRRQGGMMRGWQRKYFVLQDSCLFCFHREDDTQVGSTYLLDGYQLRDLPTSPDDPDKFPFELVTERNSGDSITLCAASDSEKKEWMKALCYHIYAGKGGAIFGLPLEEAMKYEHRHGCTIPHIVKACVEHLERYALQAEGIFRLAGRAGLLRELRGQFEMGQRPSLDDTDVHTVGSLLKAYLRELPESLVPPDLYQRVMNCAMRHAEASFDDGRHAEVLCLSQLLEELPDVNYATLAYICRFLHRLAANADQTKMTAHNLSLVFGPNLIRHMDNSPELLMLTADLTQHLAFMVITHCPIVLPIRPERESVPTGTAFDSPMLRNKHPDTAAVATADLLRMSEPVDIWDPSLLVPQPSALNDLMDLQVGPQHLNPSDKTPSPVTPPNSFVFVDDYFDESSKSVAEKRASRYAFGRRSEENSLTIHRKPVPPKRTKSKTMRSRRSACTPSSPLTPDSPRPLDSPRQLDCQDILTALACVSQGQTDAFQATEETSGTKGTSRESPPSTRSMPVLDNGGGEGQASHCPDLAPEPENQHVSADSVPFSPTVYCSRKARGGKTWKAPEADTDVSSDTGRIRPSQIILETQVTALKLELVNVKARSERMVGALKNQLTDIRSKYEARLSSLENQHRRELVDLTAKLDTERTARANAVEKTVSLQAQLYKYKLQYGELQDSQS